VARNDDEEQWRDDPLVRALRAPGTPAELADEHEFVAAFRDSRRGSGSVRRLVGRFGIGATTAVTTIALTAGVAAAAYTQTLPDPVQRFAHRVLEPVGVPAPPPVRPAAPTQAQAPVTTPSKPHPTSAATTTAAKPTPTASTPPPILPTAGASILLPPESPDPTAPTTPSVPPASDEHVRTAAAALSLSVSSSTAVVGSTVTVSGVVTSAEGRPLRHRRVRLLARSAGQKWSRVATARTDRAGGVTFETPALGRTTKIRLRTTDHVRSTSSWIVVKPIVTAQVSETAGISTVVVTVQGGQPADSVSAYRRRDGRWVKVASVQLDENASTVLTVPTPKHRVHLVVRARSTREHGHDQTVVVLGAPS
jgi:5-hydroxyisourate hydrolase-like protein (transthyretin family)